jgi:predicted P-loop ATPase
MKDDPTVPLTIAADLEDAHAALGRLPKLEAPELLATLSRPPYHVRFNTFTQKAELNGEPIPSLDRFYIRLAMEGFKCSKDLAIDCLMEVAHQNAYSPVVEYLDGVAERHQPPDDALDFLATTYLRPGAPADGPTLYDEMVKNTLIGAVARAYEPGCKHDSACVITGPQGARKSTFWSTLGGPFFSDSLGGKMDKDSLMVLHRSWIMEWSELDQITSKRHSGQIKAFLTTRTDTFRAPYARDASEWPRAGIIVGSANTEEGLLNDDTGNRRFWIIPTTCTEQSHIDVVGLAAERDMIWAAAVHAHRAGTPRYLSGARAMEVEESNDSYMMESPWEAAIIAYLRKNGDAGGLTTHSLLTLAIEKPVERQSRADQMIVASILKRLGYRRTRSMEGGNRTYRYIKPE